MYSPITRQIIESVKRKLPLIAGVITSMLLVSTDCPADLDEVERDRTTSPDRIGPDCQSGQSDCKFGPTPVKMKEWNQCLEALVHPRGVRLEPYLKYIVSKDPEFVKTALAVMYVETRFNHASVSDKQAYGLMQMTAEAVTDAAQFCKLPSVTMQDMLIPATNIKYGTCYLQKLLKEFDGDWDKALIAYNGGYRQLTYYMDGRSMTKETANYLAQVRRVLKLCGEVTQ